MCSTIMKLCETKFGNFGIVVCKILAFEVIILTINDKRFLKMNWLIGTESRLEYLHNDTKYLSWMMFHCCICYYSFLVLTNFNKTH